MELTVGRVQSLFTALVRGNTVRGRSPSTLVRIRAALHAALNGAIRRGLIETNPAHWVQLPTGRRVRAVVWTEPRVAHWRATGQRPSVAVWTPAQTAAFLAHTRGHPWYVLFHLIALLGLRRGEAAGLRWCDLDLEAGVLMVSHQIRDECGHTVVCPPKTEASVRTVALDRHTVLLLRRLRSRRPAGRDSGPVFLFVTQRGRPVNPAYLTRGFARLVAAADLPPIRLHDLRHGAASLSLAAGNELKTVQAMLGHSSIVVTADTYTSVLPCLAHQAAEATAALVLNASATTSRSIRRRAGNRRLTRRKSIQRIAT